MITRPKQALLTHGAVNNRMNNSPQITLKTEKTKHNQRG